MPRDVDDYDDPDGPGEHDAHLLDEDEIVEHDLAQCPTCGKAVSAHATACHRCGASFGKEAWLAEAPWKSGVWTLAAIGVILAMLWFIWG